MGRTFRNSKSSFLRRKLRLEMLEDRAVPAIVTVNTTNLTITGDDGNANTMYNVPFTAAISGGIATFYIRGNLNVPVGDTIKGVGANTAVLFAGNDITIPAGAVLDFSGSGQAGGPGGGSGGIATSGGSGRGWWLRRQRRDSREPED